MTGETITYFTNVPPWQYWPWYPQPQVYVTYPTRTPHTCPVCKGTGLVSRPPHVPGDVETWPDSGTGPYPCKPCNGEGVLWS